MIQFPKVPEPTLPKFMHLRKLHNSSNPHEAKLTVISGDQKLAQCGSYEKRLSRNLVLEPSHALATKLTRTKIHGYFDL